MNILVSCVAASETGALSVLKDFHRQVIELDDKSVQWIFLLSTPELAETENVSVLRFPWIKKSWLHRIFFDTFKIPTLVKRYNPSLVFAMNDVLISAHGHRQVLLLMDYLPFAEHRFKLTEDPLLWFYQNPMAWMKKRSLQKADTVILQIDWMKQLCIENTRINPDKVIVVNPHSTAPEVPTFHDTPENRRRFFYPATAMKYKNHKVVLQACEILESEGVDYEVIFTLNGNESSDAKVIFDYVQKQNLKIKFVGMLPREQVFETLTRSVLLFPSFIETFGVPLVEGMGAKTFVLSTTCIFSRELLHDYPNARLFEPFDAEELARLMKGCNEFTWVEPLVAKNKMPPVRLAEVILAEAISVRKL